VEINFAIGSEPAVFRRGFMIGRAEIVVGGELITLQSPWKLSTHLQLNTEHAWRKVVRGHEVEVVKKRPRIFGGIRPNSFTILVDSNVAATSTGL
jgi:hypothetical protein